jgi:hypothetical protein
MRMATYEFNDKTFALVHNSQAGQVDSAVLFHYQQEGDLVTADYSGGTIRYGKIIAHLQDDQLDMRYQCLTTDNELRAGKAIADISKDEAGKIHLKLNWQWLDEEGQMGTSEYIELN